MLRESFLIVFSCLFCFINLQGQVAIREFTLTGVITGKESGIIYLSYFDDTKQIGITDSAIIKNGSFTFSGRLKQPTVAFIKLEKKEAIGLNATNIFLEPAHMKLELKLHQFKNAHMTGSTIQNEYEYLQSAGDRIIKNYPQLFDSLGFVNNNLSPSFSQILKTVYDSLNQIDYNYFHKNPQSYLTAYLLQYQARNLSYDSIAIFFNRLPVSLKNHPVTQTIRIKLANKAKGSVGMIAPKFMAKGINGVDFFFGIKGNKYTLLDFWASWCVPCRQNSKGLIGLHEKYKELSIISIADDRNEQVWKEAITKDNTNLWTHIRREVNEGLKLKVKVDRGDINEKFDIKSLPTFILIDKYGVIIGRFEDGEDLLKEVDDMLKKLFE